MSGQHGAGAANLPMIGLPLAPERFAMLDWEAILEDKTPLQGAALRDPLEAVWRTIIIYTSRAPTGNAQGRDASFTKHVFLGEQLFASVHISESGRA